MSTITIRYEAVGVYRWCEFNGTSVDYTFWNATPADGALDSGQICQVRSAITKGGGSLSILGGDPSHCAHQPPCPPNGVCAFSCAGGEVISLNPLSIPGGFGPGYYEARIFNNNGFYVAFWTEGFGNTGCPASLANGFEADILEGYDSSYQSHVHTGGYGACHVQVSSPGDSGPDNDTFHVIGMRWDVSDGLRFYKDGVENWHVPGPAATSGADVRFTSMAYDDTRGPLQVDWFRYFQAQ